MKKYILLIFAFSFLFRFSSITNAQWQPTYGPYGGYVYSLTISGNNIFAGTNDGMFLSTNNGDSWSSVNKGLICKTINPIIANDTNTFAIAIANNDMTRGDIVFSNNKGSSWTKIGVANVHALALSGTNIYAGTGRTVSLSNNNGNTWTTLNKGLPIDSNSSSDVHCLATSGKNIFAGIAYGGVFLSSDTGNTWVSINSGLPQGPSRIINTIVISGTRIFIGTNTGVFLSNNNGNTWLSLDSGLTNTTVYSIAVSGSSVFAGTSSGIYVSNNNGVSWVRAHNGLKNSTEVYSVAINGANVFAGTNNGVYISNDNGDNWNSINTGLVSKTFVSAFAVSGKNIFTGTSGGGVFLSSNNGENWTQINNGLTNTNITSLAISGTNIFAGVKNGGVFLSSNNGNSWTAINNGLTSYWVTSLAINGVNIFAGTGNGVFLSTNNGGLWTQVNNGLTSTWVTSLAISGTNIFVGTRFGGIFLSTNNGNSWIPVNNGFTGTWVTSFAISGTNIYAATYGDGIFLSTNNGNSWTPMNNGLTHKSIEALAVSGTNIFAAAHTDMHNPETIGNIQLSNNNGKSWTAANKGLKFPEFPTYAGGSYLFVNALAINDSYLFAGTWGNGVWKLPLNEIDLNTISGKIFIDTNNNCQKDSTEKALKNSIVKITSDKQIDYYTTPDSNGNYSILSDSGAYTVSLIDNPYYKTTCPSSPGTYNVYFSAFHDTSAANDFGSKIDIYCPRMWVDIATSFVRPGRENIYAVNYCNKGTVPAANSYITIEFDKNITLLSSTLPWSVKNENTYTFDLGTIKEGECGSFYITDSISRYAVNGSTLCTKARIFPDTICTAQNAAWDESNISLKKECVDDTVAHFVIYNKGASMAGTSDYRLYTDNALALTKTFQLASDDSLTVDVLSEGSTIRMEADQREGHPGMSQPRETVESCKINKFPALVNSVPQDDADEFVDIDCQIVLASHDPNEKLVIPTGITDKHYISAKDELEYQINFQNTGNDTAFVVVVRDTLPKSLDISSVVSGSSSSHPYTFRIYGQGILEWTFNNILLVDSTTDEANSHGFVKYKIKQKANNPKGTLIENRAAIYFDFNAPVITNAATNTVYDTTIVNNKITILGTNKLKAPETGISLYPNPTSGTFTLSIETTSKEDVSIRVYNLVGEMLYFTTEEVNGKYSKEINLHKAPGIYFVQIQSGNRLFNKKLVVQ